MKVEWRKRPRQKVAHAYRRHRGGLLGPMCSANAVQNRAEVAREAGELIPDSHFDRCVHCVIAIGKAADEYAAPDDNGNVEPVVEFFR